MATAFITLSNIVPIPTSNSFTVTFDTDVACLMAMDWWSHNDPSITTPTAVLEGVLRTKHTIASGALPAGNHAGKFFGFSLRLDAADVTGRALRSYQGFVQLLGARDPIDVPVRFYAFSGPMTGAVPALGTAGNWSRYTWSQWNSKGT